MPRGKDYIPGPDIQFDIFQNNFTNIVAEKLSEWNIPTDEFNNLMELKSMWVVSWDKAKNKDNRTRADVVAKREARKIYQSALRKFINEWIKYNHRISDADIEALGLKRRKRERSLRPKITDSVFVLLTSERGGIIRIRCRVEQDSTKASRHRLADAIEMKYKIGEPPPKTPKDCDNTIVFTKAIHTIQMDIGQAGMKIYAFFRWKNIIDDTKSGPWSERLQTTIVG